MMRFSVHTPNHTWATPCGKLDRAGERANELVGRGHKEVLIKDRDSGYA